MAKPAIGQNQTYPFAPDAIQDDGDGDGFSTCDDPVLLVKMKCPPRCGFGSNNDNDNDGDNDNSSSDNNDPYGEFFEDKPLFD